MLRYTYIACPVFKMEDHMIEIHKHVGDMSFLL